MSRLLFALGASIWILPSLIGQTLQPWDEGATFPMVLLVVSLVTVGTLSGRHLTRSRAIWTSAALGFVVGSAAWFIGSLYIVGNIPQEEVLPFVTGFVLFWSVYALGCWVSSLIGRFIGAKRTPLPA